MHKRDKTKNLTLIFMGLGGLLGCSIFLAFYPSEWFSWPGPGDNTSSTVLIGSALIAISSATIYLLLTRNVAGQHSRSIAAGIVVFSIALACGPLAVAIRDPSPLLYGPLKDPSFYIEEGQGFGSGSVREQIRIFSKKSRLSLTIINTWKGEDKNVESLARSNIPEIDCGPMSYCEYRFEHVVIIDEPGAYERLEVGEPRRRDFVVVRASQSSTPCRLGIVYPNYTWMAYNPAGHESLYTVVPGTWIDYRDPVMGNREDFHTHEITTRIASLLLSEGNCLVPLSNSDIALTQDWKGLELVVLTGHDEFWTSSMVDNITDFISQGGRVAVFGGNIAYKEIQFDGTRMRHASEWKHSSTPEQSFLGSAFRFGGYDLLDSFSEEQVTAMGVTAAEYKNFEGLYVLNAEHPIFEGTGLANGELFGRSSKVHFQEVDGVPLIPATLKIDTSQYEGPVRDEGIISYGIATYAGKINWHGAIVEFSLGRGKVLNTGSLNWGNAIGSDDILKKMTINIIEYLLDSE